MDFESNYEISRTVDFIRTRNFTKVALQFPDELLKDSTRVAKALRSELGKGVRLYVMADTAYGSCCVDEIGASHVDADCVVHYGHACMSPTSTLPALFVFGKASIDVNACAESLCHCLSTANKPILVLYGLEYALPLENLETVVAELLRLSVSNSSIHFAKVACSSINPSGDKRTDKKQLYSHNGVSDNEEVHKYEDGNTSLISVNCNTLEPCTKYSLGGLIWTMPVGHKMEDYLLFWIGSENPAFTNVVLTFNNCEIVRYDAEESNLLKDFAHQRRILKRRYYLVEKAKDANIVGILVGTLGVAGYLRIIQQMKELIEGAGKKSYTLVMGRPSSAKLANFPECDVFVYVSCAQTALLDSKEFLAPVITPFEAVLAFSRGSKWTGEYVINFQDLTASTASEVVNDTEEARFSFIQGGYVEDIRPLENGGEHEETSLALAEATEKSLNLQNQRTDSVLFKGKATSGAEFFAARSFQGLNMQYENPLPRSYVIGRTGRASGYEDEK
ncbi:2-(3-amino-3-carboxypropyl)histidine synthase subunit 2 [Cocos nucifera]|nr:2-(3-amino-3-carboxypropyl)histidine synthase subunit 2 [Cocos nucifera]